jgi:hypothetical protein
MTTTEPEPQQRVFRAQERYAQKIVDYLWEHAEEILIANADGVFYGSSLHQLIRRVLPSAQAGEVVNILTESDAVRRAGHGLWEIRRKHVFYDDDGNEISLDTPRHGNASKAQQFGADLQTINRRVMDLEEEVATLKAIVIGWAREKGEVTEEVRNGEEGDTNSEQRRDVVGDDGA